MAKDVELCLAEARSRSLPMLLGGLVQQLWTLARPESESDADHTEFVRLFERWAGVEVAAGDAERHARSRSSRPLRHAAAPKAELFYRHESYGEPDAEVEMAYYFWLLRARGETILVDTGFDPEVGERRGRTCPCAPLGGAAGARRRARGRRHGRRDPPALRPHREPRRVPGGDADRPETGARVLDGPVGGSLPVRLARRAGEIAFVDAAAAAGACG